MPDKIKSPPQTQANATAAASIRQCLNYGWIWSSFFSSFSFTSSSFYILPDNAHRSNTMEVDCQFRPDISECYWHCCVPNRKLPLVSLFLWQEYNELWTSSFTNHLIFVSIIPYFKFTPPPQVWTQNHHSSSLPLWKQCYRPIPGMKWDICWSQHLLNRRPPLINPPPQAERQDSSVSVSINDGEHLIDAYAAVGRGTGHCGWNEEFCDFLGW